MGEALRGHAPFIEAGEKVNFCRLGLTQGEVTRIGVLKSRRNLHDLWSEKRGNRRRDYMRSLGTWWERSQKG